MRTQNEWLKSLKKCYEYAYRGAMDDEAPWGMRVDSEDDTCQCAELGWYELGDGRYLWNQYLIRFVIIPNSAAIARWLMDPSLKADDPLYLAFCDFVSDLQRRVKVAEVVDTPPQASVSELWWQRERRERAEARDRIVALRNDIRNWRYLR